MHDLSSSFVLGYHGCDRDVAEHLLRGGNFEESRNEYDWLGPGIYFWEANPRRGLEFAEESRRLRRGRIRRPVVIGAILELGLCLDLASSSGIEQVKAAHKGLIQVFRAAGMPLPRNAPDLLLRNLDCATIRVLHEIREREGKPPIDTVRGVFQEGKPVFVRSGFREKTHIQIAVRNRDCIKGVFRVHPRFLE